MSPTSTFLFLSTFLFPFYIPLCFLHLVQYKQYIIFANITWQETLDKWWKNAACSGSSLPWFLSHLPLKYLIPESVISRSFFFRIIPFLSSTNTAKLDWLAVYYLEQIPHQGKKSVWRSNVCMVGLFSDLVVSNGMGVQHTCLLGHGLSSIQLLLQSRIW